MGSRRCFDPTREKYSYVKILRKKRFFLVENFIFLKYFVRNTQHPEVAKMFFIYQVYRVIRATCTPEITFELSA